MNTDNTIGLQLIRLFCNQKSILVKDMINKSRKEPFVFYLQCLMFTMKTFMGLKEEYIANIMNCTHGNVNLMAKKSKGLLR